MAEKRPRKTERRESNRVIANFECLCTGFKRKGTSLVVDLSETGALLEEASFVPVRGELVGIAIEIAAGESGLLIGWVTRHTDNGFAVEFDESSSETQRLVREIGAIVPVDAKSGRPRK
jgi:hypothetical protein